MYGKYSLALAIHTGRINNSDIEWRTNPHPTVCPCFASSFIPNPDPSTRIPTCKGTPSHPNPVGLQDTHFRALWINIAQKWHDTPPRDRPTPTFSRFYCLCGLSFPDPTQRNTHCAIACDGRTHGAFFDELDSASGSWILIDRTNLKVLATGSARLKIPSLIRPHSSWAEYMIVLIAHSHILSATDPSSPHHLPRDSSLLTVSDSSATITTIANCVDTPPTPVSESRAPMGTISATMRALRRSTHARSLHLSSTQDNNEHNESIYSALLSHIFKRINKIMDYGAKFSRESPQSPPDFGANSDARASPPPPGFGYAITWSYNGLQAGDSPLTYLETALEAQQLNHLTHGETIGTVARLIAAGFISPAASPLTMNFPLALKMPP